jgi:lauroyl/myristoyl acyltransferase
MSLSSYLHNPKYIGKVAEYDFAGGQELFGNLALGYLNEHDDYYGLIENNLKYFGLPCDNGAVESSVRHIGYHYHEKFLSFMKEPTFYPEFHDRMTKSDDAIDEILRHQKEKRATVILSTHFGGMALVAGALNSRRIDISSIIRFPSEEIKNLIVSRSQKIIEALGYGRTRFVEVDKQPIMELAFGLKEGETFFSVLDEHTPFSVDVKFLGKTIAGGAGIDKIVEFIGREEVKVYLAIMLRLEGNYRLDIHGIDLRSDRFVQEMFDIYEKYILDHYEQWFFLQEVHENMPEHSRTSNKR